MSWRAKVSPPTTIVWPGVVTTLITDDEPHFPGEKVGQLPLALVAPLGSDHDGRGHQFVLPSGSTAPILLAGASHPGMRKIQRFS